jgi:hypothetical protein
MFGIAKSYFCRDVCEVKVYFSYSKESCKIAKCGRNPGGLVFYNTQDTGNGIIESSSNV